MAMWRTLAATGVTCVVILLLALHPCRSQSVDNHMFAYTQILASCVGRQFPDQQMARLVTAVRRCEQIAPQPLRDAALEAAINRLQFSQTGGGGVGRVIYVPVAVNTGQGGIGGFGATGLSNFPFNQGGVGGTFSPGLSQGFGLNPFSGLSSNQFGGFNRLNINQDRFNLLDDNLSNRRQPDSRFGSNNRGSGTGAFGIINTDSVSNNLRSSNPFGFHFAPIVGKQASEGLTELEEDITKDELLGKDGTSRVRTTRQTRRDHFTRIEALNYLSNMTCVLREASIIDHNNLPNYQYFENELRRMQINRDLRNDFTTGLQFCKELTQCMPVERLNHPLARELGQAIAYLRCTARTNTKACKKEEDRRLRGNGRLTGAFNFIGGNGLDLLKSVTELALADDAFGFDFF